MRKRERTIYNRRREIKRNVERERKEGKEKQRQRDENEKDWKERKREVHKE